MPSWGCAYLGRGGCTIRTVGGVKTPRAIIRGPTRISGKGQPFLTMLPMKVSDKDFRLFGKSVVKTRHYFAARRGVFFWEYSVASFSNTFRSFLVILEFLVFFFLLPYFLIPNS